MKRGERVTIGYLHGVVVAEVVAGWLLVDWDARLRRGLVHASWLARE